MSQKFLNAKQALRYNRQVVLPDFDLEKQERLLNSKLLLVGVGGLGCAAAQYLVASGVGEITLVDDDQVDSSNLQRQVLHGEADIGMNKCLSAKASLSRLNSETRINVRQERLNFSNELGLIKQHHLVLDCTDNLSTRNMLNQICYKRGIPLISGAAIRMEGHLMTIRPEQNSACYACLSQYFGEQNLTCVESGVMSPVAGVIGVMQALEAIKVLSRYGQSNVNKLMLFDAMTSDWQVFKVSKSISCNVCNPATVIS